MREIRRSLVRSAGSRIGIALEDAFDEIDVLGRDRLLLDRLLRTFGGFAERLGGENAGCAFAAGFGLAEPFGDGAIAWRIGELRRLFGRAGIEDLRRATPLGVRVFGRRRIGACELFGEFAHAGAIFGGGAFHKLFGAIAEATRCFLIAFGAVVLARGVFEFAGELIEIFFGGAGISGAGLLSEVGRRWSAWLCAGLILVGV